MFVVMVFVDFPYTFDICKDQLVEYRSRFLKDACYCIFMLIVRMAWAWPRVTRP